MICPLKIYLKVRENSNNQKAKQTLTWLNPAGLGAEDPRADTSDMLKNDEKRCKKKDGSRLAN